MSGGTSWGPTATGGRGRRWPGRLALGAACVAVGVAASAASSTAFVVRAVERERETVAIGALEEEVAPDEPLNILLVGSDSREGLSDVERNSLTLGTFEGQRADTNILVSLSADRDVISMVSIPRDLAVASPGGGGVVKVSETYMLGRPSLVQAVTDGLGLPVNHYVEVSIAGFMNTVEAVGGIDLCLEEPLVDRKSGADLPAGCQELDPQQALSYVRSREGSLGDIERIERQQQFLRALARRIVDGSLLLQPRRLRQVGDQVVENVVTDDELGVETALSLAADLQPLVADGLPMVTIPVHPQDVQTELGVRDLLVAYQPGLEAIVADVAAGRALPSQGTPEDRDETRVQLWSNQRWTATEVVASTLLYGGFRNTGSVVGELDPGARTTVHALPGHEEQAGWVAAHLGAPVVTMTPTMAEGVDADVVVAIGEDATPPDMLAADQGVSP